MTQASSIQSAAETSALRRLAGKLGAENIGLAAGAFAVVMSYSASLSPRFLSTRTFDSVAFQLPELGLLTLAMLMPIISGGHQPRRDLHGQYLRADARLGAARPMAAQTPASMPLCSVRSWPSASAPPAAWSWGR